MSLPVKKIYIDSTFRTADSLSSSSFKFQLNRNLYFPKNTVFYVEDVCIPNTWYTVDKDFNDKLYILYDITNMQVLTLAPNQHTASTLANEINRQITSDGVVRNNLTCTADLTFNSIQISNTSGGNNKVFSVFTDHDLENPANQGLFGADKPTLNMSSCNQIINNTTGTSNVYGGGRGTSFDSGFLTLTPSNIYISSPNLGTFTTLGARGETNILKKVPVTSSYGYLIVDQYTSNHDFLDCSEQTINMLEFNIKDVSGKILNLHGYNVSFSIVFSTHNEDGTR